jgi:hypothetical protein
MAKFLLTLLVGESSLFYTQTDCTLTDLGLRHVASPTPYRTFHRPRLDLFAGETIAGQIDPCCTAYEHILNAAVHGLCFVLENYYVVLIFRVRGWSFWRL